MTTTVVLVLPHLSTPFRVQALGVGFLALVVAGALLTDPVVPDRARLAAATTAGQHRFTQITSDANFGAGTSEGVRIAGGSVTMATPRGTLAYGGRTYAWSRWTLVVRAAGPDLHPADPVVEHRGSAAPLVQVQARARSTAGTVSGWKLMGAWTTRDDGFQRRSGAAQADSVASVSTDTLVARPGVRLNGYQLRVLLLRRTRQHHLPGGALPPGSGQPARLRPPGDEPAAAARQDAERAALLPDDAPRAVPPVRRRRSGLVLPHLALDAARLLPRAALGAPTTPGSTRGTPTRGSTTSPASSTTTPTRAPATGPSTRPTPPT